MALANPTLSYAHAVRVAQPFMPSILHRVQAIGQTQLLRCSLAHILLRNGRTSAGFLSHALAAVDTGALGDVLGNYQQSNKCHPLNQVSALIDATGISNVLTKVYTVGDPPDLLPRLLFLLILTYVHKLHYDARVASLVKRNGTHPIDGFVVVAGIYTILRQCHSSFSRRLLADLGQFVCVTARIHETVQGVKTPLPLELRNTIWFIKTFCDTAKISKPTDFIPVDFLSWCVN